jgi:hypothetical protein
MFPASSDDSPSFPAPAVSNAQAIPPAGPIHLPEDAREILFDTFWRVFNERQRQRKGLPPTPRSDCFPKPWFEHSYKLDQTSADLWGKLRTSAVLALEVLETPASIIGQTGLRHTLLVGHLSRIAHCYLQLERWQGEALALALLEQALALLC